MRDDFWNEPNFIVVLDNKYIIYNMRNTFLFNANA